ncbi:MAG TPA: hypothetical protein VEK83_12775 [Gemmatimonadales bacterium]|nr:hypothetical protein [Gemmatimonadales bacterium]
MTSKRWLILLSALVVMLTVAGAVSFVFYARRHAPNPRLAAVAPFDIFVPGLEPWRVRLAEGLTAQLDSVPPLAAVPQAVVRERWRGQSRPELAAIDLARRTSAGLAVYGRLDPMATNGGGGGGGGGDSVRVRLIAVEAGSGRVAVTVDRRWPVADLAALPRALADEVRHNYRYPSD